MENLGKVLWKNQRPLSLKNDSMDCGSSITIAAFISAIYLYDDYQKKLKAVEKQLVKIEESVEKSLSSSLYAEDEENAKQQLEGILKQPDMVQVQIWNEDDVDPLISLVNKEFEDFHPIQEEHLESIKLFLFLPSMEMDNLTKEKIADMHLTVSLGGAKRKIRNQIILFGLIQLIQVSLISAIIWFIFKKPCFTPPLPYGVLCRFYGFERSFGEAP